MHVDDLSGALTGIRLGGCCVQPYVDGFAAQLLARGYTVLSMRDAVTSAAHLGRWMDLCGIGIETVTPSTVVRFAKHDCMCPGARAQHRRPSRRYTARVRRFVEYLRSVGLGPRVAAPRPKVGPAPLIGFRTWMTRHRGVTSRTIKRYEDLVGKMLPALGDDPGSYDASLVRRVLLEAIRGRSHAYAAGNPRRSQGCAVAWSCQHQVHRNLLTCRPNQETRGPRKGQRTIAASGAFSGS